MPIDRSGYDAALKQIDQWAMIAQKRADHVQEFVARADAMSVSQRSAAGEVTVTVGADGALTNILFADRVSELSGARLAEEVITAYRKALSQLEDQIRQAGVETVGDDQAVLTSMTNAYVQAFEPHTRKLGPETDIRWT